MKDFDLQRPKHDCDWFIVRRGRKLDVGLNSEVRHSGLDRHSQSEVIRKPQASALHGKSCDIAALQFKIHAGYTVGHN